MLTRIRSVLNAILAGVLLVALVATTACQQKAEQLVIGTGPAGGVFQVIGGGIAQIVSEQLKNVTITPQTTAGGIENARLVGSKQVNLSLISIDQGVAANAGARWFEGEKLKLSTLGGLYATCTQIVTLASNDQINAFADLRGKKIAIGEPGGGAETAFKDWLQAADMTIDDVKAFYTNYDQAVDQMVDGVLDACVISAGAPAPSIVRLAASKPIKIISITEDHFAKYKELQESAVWVELPPGTFPGIEETTYSAGGKIIVAVAEGMSEDLAYRITKTLYTSLDKLANFHAVAKQIVPKGSADVVVPLHPGAAKFFREIGAIK